MNNLLVSESYVSLQGEGRNVGKPRHFIKLHGCNLNCKFCDSKSTWEGHPDSSPPIVVSVEEMASSINQIKRPVVWTGGEPALQDKLIGEVRKLVDWSIGFEIETNGTVMLEDPEYYDLIVVSPKIGVGPGSVVDIISRYLRINSLYDNVIFKFAVDDPKSVKDIMETCTVNPDIVYAMPITSPGTEGVELQKRFADKCVDMGINFSPRLQKLFGML